jgi:hypothetical protein
LRHDRPDSLVVYPVIADACGLAHVPTRSSLIFALSAGDASDGHFGPGRSFENLARIRHFGFLSVRRRRELIAVCRQVLAEKARPRSPTQTVPATAPTTWPCPCCGGTMIIIEKLTAEQIRLRSEEWKNLIDSS